MLLHRLLISAIAFSSTGLSSKAPKPAAAAFANEILFPTGEYQKPKSPASKAKTHPNAKRTREKLEGELADLRSSLKWTLEEAPEDIYPGLKRSEAAATIEDKIADILAKMNAL